MLKGLIAVGTAVIGVVGFVSYKVLKRRKDRKTLMGQIMIDILLLKESLEKQKKGKNKIPEWERRSIEDYIRDLEVTYKNLKTAEEL